MKRIGVFWAIFLLLVGAAPAAAQDDPPSLPDGVTLVATAGYDGYYKDAFWVPVTVEVANEGAPIEGSIRIPLDFSSRDDEIYFETPISLPTQSAKRVTIYVPIRDFTSMLDVLLLDDDGTALGGTVTNQMRGVNNDDLLYGVVSGNPGELNYLENVSGARAQAAVAFLTPDQLPDQAAGWYGLDVLVLDNVDTGRFTPAQLDAMAAWIETGGTLAVTGGSGWQQTTAAVASWLPVTPTGTTTVDDLPALRAAGGVPFRDPGPYLVTTSQITSGEVLLSDQGLPLLARRSQGRGNVFFLALDAGAAPLQDWDGAEALWARIVNNTPQLPFYATGVKQFWAAEQAATGLTPFTLPSVWWMLLFLGIYVVAVGPVNYIVLKRLDRTELAWVSIPALILVFTAGVYLIGLGGRGRAVTVNQLTVAYGQIDGDNLRRQTLLGVYSPSRTTYDVTLPADALVRPLSDQFSFNSGASLAGISRGSQTVLKDVRVDVSATEIFLVDGQGAVPALDGQAVLSVSDGRFELEVSILNNSDVTLRNASLLFGSVVRTIGDLAPGDTYRDTLPVSAQMAAAAAGTTTATTPGFVPSSTGGSPLTSSMDIVTGSSGIIDPSRELRARSSFVEALHNNYGGSPNLIPPATATLIAWSDQAPLAVETGRRQQEVNAETLYFLELPFSQTVTAAGGLELGAAFWSYEVLNVNNVYSTEPTNLYLANGNIAYEFELWPEFQDVTPTGLEVELDGMSSGPAGSANPLVVELWNWEAEGWVEIPDVTFATLSVTPFEPFLDGDNRLRIRLTNGSFSEVTIRNLHPILTGDLE